MLFLVSDSKNLEFDTALSSHSALFWEARPSKMKIASHVSHRDVHKKKKKSYGALGFSYIWRLMYRHGEQEVRVSQTGSGSRLGQVKSFNVAGLRPGRMTTGQHKRPTRYSDSLLEMIPHAFFFFQEQTFGRPSPRC